MTKRRAAKPRTVKVSEHQAQCAVFDWAEQMKSRWPELGLLHANVNAGKRSYAMAAWYKAEGLRAGVLDIHLPVARGGYFGCWIEMKAGNNKPTPEQWRWIDSLRGEDHRCAVCWSAEEAIEVLTAYLRQARTRVFADDAASEADEALGKVGT